MGQSTDGILAYGYDLGGDDEGWKLAEADEYGGWVPADAVIDDETGLDDWMRRQLLASIGFTERYEDGIAGYFGREREAEQRLGLRLEGYCSESCTSYVLAAHVITARRGDCLPVDWVALDRQRLAEDWDGKLRSAVTALGVTPTQPEPAWLLASYWG